MRLEDVMNRKVETISGNESAESAWERMRMKAIHHLVVVEKGEVLGVLSHRDLGGARGSAVRKGKTAGDLMSPHVVSAPSDATIRKAANLLRGHAIGCLPVVNGKKIVGIVTVSDLLDLIGRGSEAPIQRSERPTLSRHQSRERGGGRRG